MVKEKSKCAVMLLTLFIIISLVAGAYPPEASAKIIKLRVAMNTPTTHPNYDAYTYFFDTVTKKSDGQIQFTIHWGGSLLKDQEIVEGVATQTVDFGECMVTRATKAAPFLNVTLAPFVFDDLDHFNRVAKAGLLDWVGKAFAKQNVKLTCLGLSGSQSWFSKDKFLKRPADFKGVDMRGIGAYATKGLKVLGANVITIQTYEVVGALQRGLITTIATSNLSPFTYGWDKYVPYATFSDWNLLPRGIGVNMDTWKNLPQEIQRIIMEVGAEYMDRAIESQKADDKVFYDEWSKKGYHSYKLTPADKDEFKRALAPLYEGMKKDYPDATKFLLDLAAKNREK